jgi:hypothetical protein
MLTYKTLVIIHIYMNVHVDLLFITNTIYLILKIHLNSKQILQILLKF